MCLPLSAQRLKRGMIARRYRQQKHLCIICTEPLGNDVCIEHIWPRLLGGRNVWGNKALSHTSCNSKKGASVPSRQLIRRFQRWTGERIARPFV